MFKDTGTRETYTEVIVGSVRCEEEKGQGVKQGLWLGLRHGPWQRSWLGQGMWPTPPSQQGYGDG